MDQVVLCVGHMPVDTHRSLIGLPGYGHDASTFRTNFDALRGDETVGIIGTRLCAYDVALELQARQHRGPIWMCSRNGQLPSAFSPIIVLLFIDKNGVTTLPRSIDDLNEQNVKELRLKYFMPNIQQDTGQYSLTTSSPF